MRKHIRSRGRGTVVDCSLLPFIAAGVTAGQRRRQDARQRSRSASACSATSATTTCTSSSRRAHPDVTIKEDIESYADHHSNLAKHLATGAGADDIVAIEVGFIAQFKAQPQNFVRPATSTAPRR